MAATWRSLLKFSSIREIGRGMAWTEISHWRDRRGGGGIERDEVSRAHGLYFSRVVIKVYYANEIMSAPLFYRG